MTRKGEIQKTKLCPKCGRVLPRSSFWPRSKGSHLIQSYCKKCHAKQNKEWAQKNWKKYNAMHRAAYRRRMQDPAYAEKMKNEWREEYEKRKNDPSYREARRLASRIYREKNGMSVRSSGKEDTSQVRLPSAPFAEWLRVKIEEEGIPQAQISHDSGIDERRLYAVRVGEQTNVTERVVDAVLTAFDDHIMFLYPELYE